MKEFLFKIVPADEGVPGKVTHYTAVAETLNAAIEETLAAVGVDYFVELRSIRLLSTTLVPVVTLSTQELRVAVFIAKGMMNKEIAHEMGISINTVKHHIGWINVKLGVNNRTQIANKVLSHEVTG